MRVSEKSEGAQKQTYRQERNSSLVTDSYVQVHSLDMHCPSHLFIAIYVPDSCGGFLLSYCGFSTKNNQKAVEQAL